MEQNLQKDGVFWEPVTPAKPAPARPEISHNISKALNFDASLMRADERRALHAVIDLNRGVGDVLESRTVTIGSDDLKEPYYDRCGVVGGSLFDAEAWRSFGSFGFKDSEGMSTIDGCTATGGAPELENTICMQLFPMKDASTEEQINKTVNTAANISSAETAPPVTRDGISGNGTKSSPVGENVVPSPEIEASNLQNSQSPFGLDSSSEKKQNLRKRKNTGIDLNKKPRQRPKMKKVWPKIFDESKPKKIPKSEKKSRKIPEFEKNMRKTPKSEKKTTKKKVRENNLKSGSESPYNPLAPSPQTPEPVALKQIIAEMSSCETCEKSRFVTTSEHATRRALNFSNEHQVKYGDDARCVGFTNTIQINGLEREQVITTEPMVVHERDNQSKCRSWWDFNLPLKAQDFDSCLELQKMLHQYNRRKGRPESWNNKTLEFQLKDFPKTCMKMRRRRRRATVYPYFFVVTSTSPLLMLPTLKQIFAAIMDPKSFQCALALQPNVKSKKKRSMRSQPKLVDDARTLQRRKECKLGTLQRRKQYKTYTRRNKLLQLQVVSDISMGVPNNESQHFPLSSQFLAEDGFLGVEICMPQRDENDPDMMQQTRQENVARNMEFYHTIQHMEINNECCHSEDSNNLPVKSLVYFLTLKLRNLTIRDENESSQLVMQYQSVDDAGVPITDGNESKQLVVRDQCADVALVSHVAKLDPAKKNKVLIDLDPETMRAWKLLMENDGSGVKEETDKEQEKWWKDRREIFRGRVDSYIARMNHIQGNRCFTPWKGSVVDSVVGVFLTQNVSDHLSSNAFMSLIAKYPIQSEHKTCDGDEDAFSQESVGSNPIQSKPNTHGGDENLPFSQKSVGSNPIQSEPNTHDGDEDIPFIQESESVRSKVEIEGQTNINFDSNNNKQGERIDKDNGSHKEMFESGTNSRKNKGKLMEEEESSVNWDELRKTYSRNKLRTGNTRDSADWNAVRCAKVEEIADTIVERGMHNVLAARIKEFLDRILKDHGSIDLEWLRDVPPDKAKEYLLSIPGLGLKSVECLRLLTLHHHAFPVDTNVGRLAVRLGWVPLQPLPGDVQFHLLEQYPLVDAVQKYLWPRLCTLGQEKLYELHYHMITFGKVFCTKRQPSCHVCPIKGECRHFASALASARFCLPGPQEKSIVRTNVTYSADPDSNMQTKPPKFALLDGIFSESSYESKSSEPIIEYPASPEPEYGEALEQDIEDLYCDSDGEIPIIRLSDEELKSNVLKFIEKTKFVLDGSSNALVALTPQVASIPMPKLRNVSRLRTTHHVYELPDTHALLIEFEKREPDDPCPYLLALWVTGSTTQDSKDAVEGQNDQTVHGTILIPCRTATRGSFPLNGTYFQVNEVFADDESSQYPISVPRSDVWDLQRRFLYCGTSASSIVKGLSTIEIGRCFLEGFICVRGFNRKTRTPKPLPRRFHPPRTVGRKTKDDYDE